MNDIRSKPSNNLLLTFALVLAVTLAPVANAETSQPRTGIGVGSVSPGLGQGPGSGQYKVWLNIRSHKRFAAKADDGGHEEWLCSLPDATTTNPNKCGVKPPETLWPFGCSGESGGLSSSGWYNNFMIADGVALKKRLASIVSVTGPIQQLSMSIHSVTGSLNNCAGGKWEWASEGYMDRYDLPSSLRWTTRDIPLVDFEYVVPWSGNPLQTVVRVSWTESDPGWGPFDPSDDDSEWAYFKIGDMLTKCLQGGTENLTRLVLPASSDFYWFLCSEAGGCSSPKHYKIKTYYRVDCKWRKKTAAVTACEQQCEDWQEECLGWNPYPEDIERCELEYEECLDDCYRAW